MLHVTEAEAKERIKELLDAAERGDEVVVARGDRPSIRFIALKSRLPSNAEFRATISPSTVSTADIVSQERDGEGG